MLRSGGNKHSGPLSFVHLGEVGDEVFSLPPFIFLGVKFIESVDQDENIVRIHLSKERYTLSEEFCKFCWFRHGFEHVALVCLVLFFDTRWKMAFELSQDLPQQDSNDVLRLLIFIGVTEKEIQNAELRRFFELIEEHRPVPLVKFPHQGMGDEHKVRFSGSSYKTSQSERKF